MIHTFKAVGQPMALDVGSGAVHALDELSFAALKLWDSKTPDDIRHTLKETFLKTDVDEVIEELLELERMGYINAPDNYENVTIAPAGVVKAMCLHAAHDCNLRCQYCFAATGDFHMGGRCLLSYEIGEKALDWLIKNSGNRINLEVDFFGGEPTMNMPVVRKLVAYGRSLEEKHNKRFKFTITTNCLTMDQSTIDFLNREMANVVLSMDGRPEVHDRMRPTVNGKGSYELIMPRAQNFVRQRGDKEYYVRGTFTAYNTDFAADVLHLADQGFEQLSIEPVVTDPSVPYALKEEHLPAILNEYEKLAEIYYDRRKNGQWFNFFHFMVDLEGGPCLRKRLTGCGAGNEYVAVTPAGDIYPCHQFVGREGYRMGSVLTNEFNTGLQQMFHDINVLKKEKCRDCFAKYFCSGGCIANAHAFSGDINTPNDLECQMTRKRLECAMALYALEQAEKA